MTTITREIHVDAPPEVVRRHLTDPDVRPGWLDGDAGTGTGVTPGTAPDGAVTFGERDADGTSHVRIEVHPDGDGARVAVTIELVPAADHPVSDDLLGLPGDTGPEATAPVLLAA